MDTAVSKVIREDFTKYAIQANEVNIQRAEFGFVQTDCNFIKTMISTICIHAMENNLIFNDIQFSNIINIINRLSHD